MTRSDVFVSYHQLLVAEGDARHPTSAPNGLTAANPGAAVILTGIHTGRVDVTVRLENGPPAPADGWEEVEEIELTSLTGETHVHGLMGDHVDALPNVTPQGPGRYGMRVHARGRELAPTAVPDVPFEFYLITVWPIDVGQDAARRLGVGVAEELGLPRKATPRPADEAPGRTIPHAERVPGPFRGYVHVNGHHLRILNPYQNNAPAPPEPDDLVAVAPDSILVRTLKPRGMVALWVNWRREPRPVSLGSWRSCQEVEFVTRTGVMHVEGLTSDDNPNLTFQGAGRYGLRVYGRERRLTRPNDPREAYMLEVWPVLLG